MRALHHRGRSGNTKRKTLIVSLCIFSVLSAVNSTAATSDSPLIAAVRAGKADAVRALLKQNVDVNASQGDGATALHWAVHLDDLATTICCCVPAQR